MRYILDDLGYIETVSSHLVECNNKGCTAYTGAIPEGYETLEEWACNANIRAYKLDADGNLIFDADRDAALQEEFNRKVSTQNIMTLKLNSYVTCVAGDYMQLDLSLYCSIGNKLIFENGGIKIGAGVSKVKVSGNMSFSVGSTGAKHLHIDKNNIETIWMHQVATTTSNHFPLAVPPVLIEVQENDIFTLKYYATAKDKVIGHNMPTTYLTVEVVE